MEFHPYGCLSQSNCPSNRQYKVSKLYYKNNIVEYLCVLSFTFVELFSLDNLELKDIKILVAIKDVAFQSVQIYSAIQIYNLTPNYTIFPLLNSLVQSYLKVVLLLLLCLLSRFNVFPGVHKLSVYSLM